VRCNFTRKEWAVQLGLITAGSRLGTVKNVFCSVLTFISALIYCSSINQVISQHANL
jgi:hypothetical protein